MSNKIIKITDILKTTSKVATKKYMTEILEELNKSDSLKKCDVGALKMLATAYNQYQKCIETLDTEGMIIRGRRGQVFPHPANQLASKYYAQVLSYQAEFGLTIKARSKFAAPAEENPLDAFMK